MTDTLEQLRTKLHARIREVHEARRSSGTGAVNCAHKWQRFKQTIVPDNERFTDSAHFVIKACTVCKRKELIDYVRSGR